MLLKRLTSLKCNLLTYEDFCELYIDLSGELALPRPVMMVRKVMYDTVIRLCIPFIYQLQRQPLASAPCQRCHSLQQLGSVA